VAQVVDCLLCKHNARVQTPIPPKQTNKKQIKKLAVKIIILILIANLKNEIILS
jgi:hypothetical protein